MKANVLELIPAGVADFTSRLWSGKPF